MEKKEFGTQLEQQVANKFIEIGFPYARPTKGSGARGEGGDVNNPICYVECKARNTQDITLKEDVWKKLCSEVPLHSKRLPLYVLGNTNKRTWCVMDIDDYFKILGGYLENEKNKETK